MTDRIDRIQQLSQGRVIPPKLVLFMAQIMCGEDVDVPCGECREDSRLALMALYGWQRDASPKQSCPICELIEDTCPYHRGVDDAIETDLAAGMRAAVRRPHRRTLPKLTVREWLWLLFGVSLVVVGCGATDPYRHSSDLLFVAVGLLGVAVSMFGMAMQAILPMVRKDRR